MLHDASADEPPEAAAQGLADSALRQSIKLHKEEAAAMSEHPNTKRMDATEMALDARGTAAAGVHNTARPSEASDAVSVVPSFRASGAPRVSAVSTVSSGLDSFVTVEEGLSRSLRPSEASAADARAAGIASYRGTDGDPSGSLEAFNSSWEADVEAAAAEAADEATIAALDTISNDLQQFGGSSLDADVEAAAAAALADLGSEFSTDLVVPAAVDPALHDAACRIQGMVRSRMARSRVIDVICRVYQRVYDPDTRCSYYWNSVTQQSMWEKPLPTIMGDLDITLTPRSALAASVRPPVDLRRAAITKAYEMSQTQAALRVQCAFRATLARRRVTAVIRDVYQKVLDPTTGTVYYYNKVTGASSWERPLPYILGSDDLALTPRSALLASGAQAPEQTALVVPRPARTAADLSDDDAAVVIQCMVRQVAAIAEGRRRLALVWEKCLDEGSGFPYYWHTVRCDSTWEPPVLALCRNGWDLPEQPPAVLDAQPSARSVPDGPPTARAVALRSAMTSARRAAEAAAATTPAAAAKLSESKAAVRIQCMVRSHNARAIARGLVTESYVRAFDESSGYPYWYNVNTGASQWHKPMRVAMGLQDVAFAEF